MKVTGRRIFAGLLSLAATAILAAGLLIIVASRPTQTVLPPTGVGPIQGIEWQPPTLVSAAGLDFGPFLARANGRLFMLGQEHSTVTPGDNGVTVTGGAITVWSSSDGTSWAQVSDPGAFVASGSRFAPLGFSDDGRGGLMVVGNTFVGNDLQGGMAWHSTDGRTWTQQQIGSSNPAALFGVAAKPGVVVAFGQLIQQAPTPALAAWVSTDGLTWSESTLPDSTGYTPRTITAWKGGFVAVAVDAGASMSRAWTSVDGRGWEEAPTQLSSFDATAMAALGDGVVAVGSRLDNQGMSPACWRSRDGRTWVESTVTVSQPALGFTDVTVIDDTLVAIGVGQVAVPASTTPPGWTPPPTPAASIWISADGSTWRLLAANPSLTLTDRLRTHIASLGDRVVVVASTAMGVEVFAGSVTRGRSLGASPSPTGVTGASATPSTGLPTQSPPPQSSGLGGPALVQGEEAVQMGRTATGGWLLTQTRLLTTDGSNWRDCWSSGTGIGRSMPGMDAIFVGGVIHVQVSDQMWTSADECATWSQTSFPVDPIGLAFPTAKVGYIVGGYQTLLANPNATIFKTEDGGTHWRAAGTVHVSDQAVQPMISFADPVHGWVTDGVTVWTTSNGGAAWSKTTLPKPGSVAGSLDVLMKSDAGDGSAVIAARYDTTFGRGGAPLQLVFYRTADFGAHWTVASVIEVPETHGLSLVDTRTWVVLDPSEPAAVRTTTDAGSAWQTTAVRQRWPFTAVQIDFADATHGWLVVREPYPPCPQTSSMPAPEGCGIPPPPEHLVATDDGGATWVELTP